MFSNKKIITIYDTTDKLNPLLNDIIDKYPKNVCLIFCSNILEKKSKLRKLFETNNDIICIPCYLDEDRDLGVIAKTELKKNGINFRIFEIVLIYKYHRL